MRTPILARWEDLLCGSTASWQAAWEPNAKRVWERLNTTPAARAVNRRPLCGRRAGHSASTRA